MGNVVIRVGRLDVGRAKIGTILMRQSLPGAVIFDMDGLMFDTEPLYRAAWQQAGQRVGHEMSDDFYATFVGRRVQDCETMLIESFGADFPLAEFQSHSTDICRALMPNSIPRKAGLVELLDFLKRHHVLCAVATSTSRASALRYLGDLVPSFSTFAGGDEVEHGKPAPDIFLLAAERLKIAPEHCLVLEDSVNGASAGLAAGMNVIVVPDLVPPAPQATVVCDSLHDVRILLEKAALGD